MKHIVIFQGKKYISSKRASKVSDYSSDYIGQLCRAAKLDAKMFGHTWFVTEESLTKHMSLISSGEAFKGRSKNFVTQEQSSTDQDAMDTQRISAKQAAEISGYSADYIGQLCRSGKLDAKMFGHTWYITQESLHQYIRTIEQEQRYAEYQKISRKAFASSSKNTSPVSYKKVSLSHVAAAQYPSPRSRFAHPLRTSVLTLALVVVCVAAASLSLTHLGGAGNVAVQHSSVAGVYTVAESVINFFRRGYDAIIARLIKGRELTVRTSDADDSTVSDYGIVVSPSTGNVAEDAARTQDIKNTFSDEVNVYPDHTGAAGVITPVFKTSNGKNFTYVLVPVAKSIKSSGNSP